MLRDSRTPDKVIEHTIQEGDVFKLGRIQMRVRETYASPGNEGFKTDSETEGIIDVPPRSFDKLLPKCLQSNNYDDVVELIDCFTSKNEQLGDGR